MNKSTKQLLLPNLIIAIVIALSDLASKKLIFSFIDSTKLIPEVNQGYFYLFPFFNLVKVWNRGVSFGMFNNIASAPTILSTLQTIIISILIYLVYRNYKKASAINEVESRLKINSYAMSLIIGGALGNLADRLKHGAVADFIDIHLFGYHWPAFNLADSSICIGVTLLLFCDLTKKSSQNAS